jgi:hypothetical protein
MNLVTDFHHKALNENIFNNSSFNKSKVASMWYQFSIFIPRFLAKLALATDSKIIFSRIISICNEEMGEGNIEKIHSDEFKSACENVGVKVDLDLKVEALEVLNSLKVNQLENSKILGIHLGLEVIANENINQLLEILGSENRIDSSEFFKTHISNEDEHIRKCSENYYLCKTDQEKADFMSGFYLSLKFWKIFWEEASIYE